MDNQGTNFGVDRLMPRHAAGASLEIEWNTAMHKRRFRAPYKNSAPAVIRELSLAGALIDAPVPPKIKVGDRIEIGIGDLRGIVEVKHVQEGPSDDRALFGVQFIDVHEMTDVINDVVGQIRGHAEELDLAWQRDN